jgi:hypothetical protein
MRKEDTVRSPVWRALDSARHPSGHLPRKITMTATEANKTIISLKKQLQRIHRRTFPTGYEGFSKRNEYRLGVACNLIGKAIRQLAECLPEIEG